MSLPLPLRRLLSGGSCTQLRLGPSALPCSKRGSRRGLQRSRRRRRLRPLWSARERRQAVDGTLRCDVLLRDGQRALKLDTRGGWAQQARGRARAPEAAAGGAPRRFKTGAEGA
jgi:hypothetical protein